MKTIPILETAFATALLSDLQLQRHWVAWSFKMSALTGHGMTVEYQPDYHFDMLLRSLEDDHAHRYATHLDGRDGD